MSRNSMQLSMPPMPVEKVSLAREIAQPAAWESAHPTQGEQVSLTTLLADSCSDCGLSEKDAALTQGYDPRYWPRVKSGEKQAHLERLARLPETVQREFIKRWARQLRMEVRDHDARTRAVMELIEVAAKALREISA